MSVNKAILLGRLGKDPELRYTPSGKAVASFPVATDRRWTDSNGQKQQQTTWHNIVAWGRTAEVMKEYLSKGREVFIEGRIENRTYDKKDGTKGYASEVIVESFSFVGSRGDSGGDSSSAPSDADYSQEAPPVQGGSGGGDDDDLPF